MSSAGPADLLILTHRARPRPEVPIEKRARAGIRAVWVPPHRAAAGGRPRWGRCERWRRWAPTAKAPSQWPCCPARAETVSRAAVTARSTAQDGRKWRPPSSRRGSRQKEAAAARRWPRLPRRRPHPASALARAVTKRIHPHARLPDDVLRRPRPLPPPLDARSR